MTDVVQSVPAKRPRNRAAIVAAAVVFAALVVLQIEPDLWPVGALTMLCAMVAIVTLMVGLLRMNRGLALWSGVTLVLTLGSVMITSGIANRQERESILRGEQVATALSRYRAREGDFPESLSQLVPMDLERVPVSAMGLFRIHPIEYRKGDGAFTLWFPSIAFLVVTRMPDGRWVKDD